MPTAFDDIVPTQGFLTDRQIKLALKEGYLIQGATWDESLVRHASYTLRLGERVDVAAAIQSTRQEKKTFEIRRLTRDESIELLPGDTALLYSLEHLSIPYDVIGLTVARGLLFAESLCPENTYVDPGFSGPLYTTVTNVSNRVVRLGYGTPLARLFFFRLAEQVENPYRSGAALGISQQLQTIRATTLTTLEDCQKASTSELLTEIEKIPVQGPHIRQALLRHSTQSLRLYFLATFWPIALVIANTSPIKENLGAFVANVLASIVGSVAMLAGPWLIKQAKRS
jgi:Deoxycytidine deaminase